MDTCLHEKGRAKVVKKVGGAELIGRSAIRLGHPRPYKYPLTSGNQNTHHILEIPLAKLSFLV
jgi:hypothetical protein